MRDIRSSAEAIGVRTKTRLWCDRNCNQLARITSIAIVSKSLSHHGPATDWLEITDAIIPPSPEASSTSLDWTTRVLIVPSHSREREREREREKSRIRRRAGKQRDNIPYYRRQSACKTAWIFHLRFINFERPRVILQNSRFPNRLNHFNRSILFQVICGTI